MILEKLERIGISQSEGKVLLSLIELGRCPVSHLARKMLLARPTIYSILQNLEAKGLVSQERSGRTRLFVANHPSAFQRLIALRRQEVLELEATAIEIENLLTPYFSNFDAHIPRLKFYEGARNVENMLYEMLPEWERSMSAEDRTLWGFQDPSFVAHHSKWLKHHWKRNESQKIEVKLFSNDVQSERNLRGKVRSRETKVLPANFAFRSSIWICGDYTIVLVTHKKPHYAFHIRDALLSSNLRDIFKMLWWLRLPGTAR